MESNQLALFVSSISVRTTPFEYYRASKLREVAGEREREGREGE